MVLFSADFTHKAEASSVGKSMNTSRKLGVMWVGGEAVGMGAS